MMSLAKELEFFKTVVDCLQENFFVYLLGELYWLELTVENLLLNHQRRQVGHPVLHPLFQVEVPFVFLKIKISSKTHSSFPQKMSFNFQINYYLSLCPVFGLLPNTGHGQHSYTLFKPKTCICNRRPKLYSNGWNPLPTLSFFTLKRQ